MIMCILDKKNVICPIVNGDLQEPHIGPGHYH